MKRHLYHKGQGCRIGGGRQVKRNIALVLVLMAAVLATAGLAAAAQEGHKHGPFTKHYDSSLFEVTKNGLYSVEMVLGDHELMTGVNAVEIIIHDNKDRDVVGAQITVTPWMPTMGHGVFDQPVITEKGGGLYAVDNITLIMTGLWELRIDINKGGAEDTAVFSFPDVKVGRNHTHMMMKVPENLDFATERMSENKIFSLSYKSEIGTIPINRIHEWRLMLKNADGKPVTGAQISLDGDMPQHGHGLPTVPEVTQDLGNGEYIVEGMKFSMPGWWEMKFNVRAGDKDDTVIFNLMLTE